MRLSICLIGGAALLAAACSNSGLQAGTGGTGEGGAGGAAGIGGAATGAAGASPGGAGGDAGGATPQQCTASQPIEACPTGQVCDLDAPGRCGTGAILFGHCTVTPQTCAADDGPVCGCDGQTYPSDCVRQMAQAQLNYMGACRDAGASTNCGSTDCDATQTYCLATNPGYPGNPPWTYACKSIPTDCATNPSCACVCPDPSGCLGSYVCSCSEQNGLVWVSCQGDR